MRQSLFDLLGQRMDGLAVLDLYAGTGAMGLEAISRGAASAVFVEKDARACAVIHGNVADLRFEDRCRVVRDELPEALRRIGGKFDLVFSDPPYALRAGQAVVDSLSTNDLLAPGGRVVLEMEKREETPVCPAGMSVVDERRYGDTRVIVVRAG